MIYCICSSVQTCLAARSYGWNWFQRNGPSKRDELYKNCRINTYRKCILFVCLYNWLRCTVHTVSNSFRCILCILAVTEYSELIPVVMSVNELRTIKNAREVR